MKPEQLNKIAEHIYSYGYRSYLCTAEQLEAIVDHMKGTERWMCFDEALAEAWDSVMV